MGQRTLIQASLDRGPFTTLLVTFGLSVIIENALLEVFSADSHSIDIGSLVSAPSSSPASSRSRTSRSGSSCVAVVVLLGLQYFLSRLAHRPA